MFLGLQDPDPSLFFTDPDLDPELDPDSSIDKQKKVRKTLISFIV
jgi:hypothetical protein